MFRLKDSLRYPFFKHQRDTRTSIRGARGLFTWVFTLAPLLLQNQLDEHLRQHNEKWSSNDYRRCKLCRKQFTQPGLYRLHLREHYKVSPQKDFFALRAHVAPHLRFTLTVHSLRKLLGVPANEYKESAEMQYTIFVKLQWRHCFYFRKILSFNQHSTNVFHFPEVLEIARNCLAWLSTFISSNNR